MSATGTPEERPCAPAPPDRAGPLLDDFEDGDTLVLPGVERVGWWSAWNDATEGGYVSPDAAHLSPSEREDGGKALHFVARGLSVWGATLGVNLQWTRHRVRCPLNASRYRGLRLTLKGSGSLPVQVATFDTTGPPGGGDCSEKCYDHHQVIVQASPEWTTHEIRWEALHQEGWGKPAAFDAASVVGIYFAPRPADLPLDVWIDDVGFIEP